MYIRHNNMPEGKWDEVYNITPEEWSVIFQNENGNLPEGFKIEVKLSKPDEINTQRNQEVSQIVVTLQDGAKLDGDETSQSRISRAILGLPDDTTEIGWVGADGTIYQLTKPQLQEALALAGQAQTAIWAKYAQLKAEL